MRRLSASRSLVLVCALAVTAAGCGGKKTSTPAPPTTSVHVRPAPKIVPKRKSPPKVAKARGRVAFASCMSGAGYTGRSVTVTPRYTATFNRCRRLLPNDGEVPKAALKKLKTGTKQYAQCMRANGIKSFPDPLVTKFGAAIRVPKNYDSPQYKAASYACQAILYALSGQSPPT
jgi:hypothetical protein